MIISPLIMRRQLWLTGVLLVLTTILIAGNNGLASALVVRVGGCVHVVM